MLYCINYYIIIGNNRNSKHGTNVTIRASRGVYQNKEMPEKYRALSPTGGGIMNLNEVKKSAGNSGVKKGF